MLRGLTTTTFVVDDLSSAVAWYTELLGVEPYFVSEADGTPAYIEFRIGDFQHELGFLDARFAPWRGTGTDVGTALTYWAVDDVEAAYERLLALGATPHQDVTERGAGFVTASVVDPFGNVLGVMYNQHYLDTVASTKGA
ncbi:VOC family protein [Rhodococcus sp. CH91]|uniref:VOC family protein n=1 Tax=Rhodococcus sp. CH91 TaxID=2910256 RepID=UPI001F4B1864|nr:VOC family protein [Rhodococcus sp. CH91]